MTNPTDPRIEAVARARFNHTRQKVMLERPGVSIVDFDELHEKDKEYWKEGVPEELKAADEAAWLPIESAPKDGTEILAKVRDDLYPAVKPERPDLERWNGRWIVVYHPGILEDGFDLGWGVAAPVGHGGFPDAWFDGWTRLSKP